MIAEIIPLKRQPRHLGTFSYRVPTALEEQITVGQLVRIPYRTSELFGLVFSLGEGEAKNTDKLKEVAEIMYAEPLVDISFLNRLQGLSTFYGVSPATLAKLSILPLPRKKLPALELKPLPPKIDAKIRLPDYRRYRTQAGKYNYILEQAAKPVLILEPTVAHVHELYEQLPEAQRRKAVVWHTELTTRQKRSAWLAIRNQTAEIIIGTRSAVLLPYPKLKEIVIDHEADDNHKHWDQAPRFHVKDLAPLLAADVGARVTWLGQTMSSEAYYLIQNGQLMYNGAIIAHKQPLFAQQAKRLPTLVEITQEPGWEHFRAISVPVARAIERAVDNQQSMFLFINRKGFAPILDPVTGQKPPGIGTETIEAEVKRLLPASAPHRIVRVEADHVPELPDGPCIIIGTIKALPLIDWSSIALAALLDVDRQLALPEFGAVEGVWHSIAHLLTHANPDTELLIQTKRPDHFVFAALTEPDRFYRLDLHYRQKAGQPPYRYYVRYLYAHQSKALAQEVAARTHIKLRALTNDYTDVILTDLFMLEPPFYRHKHWFACMVSINPGAERKLVPILNQAVGNQWKIDPRPISILSV